MLFRFIKSYIEETHLRVGLSDIGHEGQFVWLDGVKGTADNIRWRVGEPNNQGNKDCYMIWRGRNVVLINDYLCSGGDLYQGLCEKRSTGTEQ